jgi:hypothetical protein
VSRCSIRAKSAAPALRASARSPLAGRLAPTGAAVSTGGGGCGGAAYPWKRCRAGESGSESGALSRRRHKDDAREGSVYL